MRITLKSIGSAKMEPNYVNASIYVRINDVDKDRCGKCLIDIIGNLDDDLKKFLKIVYFNNYSIQEVTKSVETTNKLTGKTERKNVFDYYAGSGTFSVEFALDFKTIEKVTEVCKQFSKDFTNDKTEVSVSPQFVYTLTEEDFSNLNSQAVNNALDKMKIQAKNIAQHLGLPNVELIEVNFVENSFNSVDSAVFAKRSSVMYDAAPSYKSFTIASLDEILKFKEVEISTNIYSNWSLS